MTDPHYTQIEKLGLVPVAEKYDLEPDEVVKIANVVLEVLAADASKEQARGAAEHFGHALGDWFPTRNVGVEAAECQNCGKRVMVDTRGNVGGEATNSECSPMEGV